MPTQHQTLSLSPFTLIQNNKKEEVILMLEMKKQRLRAV